jgi:L-arginine dehydrogenase
MDHFPILDETTALSRLDKSLVLGALESAFAGLASGRSVQPTQTVAVLPDGRGDCIFYPGALIEKGLIGVKVSPYLQVLADAGTYPVTAYTLLISASTGRPLLLCDSYALTSIRTAATTALAVRHLTYDSARVLAVLGTGKVGREHLKYALDLRPWDEIRVYSPSVVNDPERQRAVRQAAGPAEVKFAESAEVAARGSDVILLCTSSGTPVIRDEWVGPKTLVTSISTNSPGAHEIEPVTLTSYDVFCDYRATAPTTAGEMKIAIDNGTWSADAIVADLPDLATDTHFLSSRRRFFRSTGLGIEDLAIAGLLVE